MERIDQALDNIDRGTERPSTMRESRQTLGSDPLVRPDIVGTLSRMGRRIFGGQKRDDRDNSRSSKR